MKKKSVATTLNRVHNLIALPANLLLAAAPAQPFLHHSQQNKML
jgi:hypothetical protein